MTIKENYPNTFMAEALVSLSLITLQTDHPDLKDTYYNERAFIHDNFFEYFDVVRMTYTPFLKVINDLITCFFKN